MIEWLSYKIPVEIMFAGAAVAVFFIWRYFGLRAVLGAIIGFLLLLAKAAGRQEGWNKREEKGRKDAHQVVRKARDARADSDRINSDPERLRDDDGFRRD